MNYILYCRKSSEDKGRQILSLDSQEIEMKKIALSHGLSVSKVFKESKSAKAPNNRPLFLEMIQLIEEKKADGILCWKIDRLSRNPEDSGKIQWLLQQNKLKVIQTSDRQYLPTDNVVVLSVESSVANQYILDLSKNVKRGNRAKLEKGGWPGPAPIGYINDKVNKTLVIDKVRAPYILKAFELYSTGAYSYQQITDILYNEGFRYKSGKKIYRSAIQRIVSDPIYHGVMYNCGKYYKGNHTPIISKTLFDKTQKAIEEKLHPKMKTQFFPFRGFLKCESCGCMLTASRKKEKHVYYYCTNGKGSCSEHKKYLNNKDTCELFSEIFTHLDFDEKLFNMAFKAFKVKFLADIENQDVIINNLKNNLKILQNKEDRLLELYLSEKVPDDVYQAKYKQIQEDKLNTELEILNKSKKTDNREFTLEQVKNVFFEARLAKKTFSESDDHKKRKLLEKLLWNASIEDKKIANFKFKMPYSLITKNSQKADFAIMLGDRDSNPDKQDQNLLSYR